MQCLIDNANGSYSIAMPQPTDSSNCIFVIASPSELQNQFNITMDEATAVLPAFALLLVTGFIFRAFARALSSDERYEND